MFFDRARRRYRAHLNEVEKFELYTLLSFLYMSAVGRMVASDRMPLA